MQLSNNTVLITGGSSGIGLAFAEAFVAHGSHVLICGRTEKKLKHVQLRLPNISYLEADVAKEADRSKLLDWVQAEHPETNLLINNAGIQRRVELVDMSNELDTDEIAINLEAPVKLTALFLPHLLQKAKEGHQAAIINITSGLGYVPLAFSPIYSATKVGLQTFTRTLRHQLRGSGIKVVDIAPPAVETPLLQGAQAPNQNGGPPTVTPKAFAKDALVALQKGQSEIRVGGAQLLYLLNRFSPKLAFYLLNRFTA